MDALRFDTLARRMAERCGRRDVVKAVAGVTLALVGARSAEADETLAQCGSQGDHCGDAGPHGSRPRAGAGPATVAGQYQAPTDPRAVVVEAVVGNFLVAPEFQSGYTIVIDTLGRATSVVYPEGSLGRAGGGWTSPHSQETAIDLGASGLQRLLADLDALGFFTLPAPRRTAGAGGLVSEATVTLADGTWAVSSCCLKTAEQERRFASIQQAIAKAAGLVPSGDSTEPLVLAWPTA